MSLITASTTFQGYRRDNGRVGVRNHVIVLPVDDISNAAAEAVAHNIKGTLALPHPYGRLQFGEDLELHFRTLIGTGCNPNVAAVVVIGIEEGWTRRVVDGIAATGKPVAGFSIELHGDHDTIMRASRQAKEYVHYATSLSRSVPHRRSVGLDQMRRIGHHLGLRRQPHRGQRLRQALRAGLHAGVRRNLGADRRRAHRGRTLRQRRGARALHVHVQPLPGHDRPLENQRPVRIAANQGNIAGGLTTIEEKALGNIQKIGKRCRVDGVLDKAEIPDGPGLWFMDSSSAAAEMVTLCAASGYAVHFFPTGQGNVIGNPILPVIKICANPRTVRTMSEHIDVDTSGLLQREIDLDQAGDQLLACMLATANGRWTAAEALGHREFVLTRIFESA